MASLVTDFFLLFGMIIYMHVCMCMPGDISGQKRASDLLELDLQTIMSTMWVLGTEPVSSAGTASAVKS